MPRYAIHILGKTYLVTDANDALDSMANGASDVTIAMVAARKTLPAKCHNIGPDAWIPAPDKSLKELEIN